MVEHSSQGANPSDFTFTYGRSTAGGNSGRRVLAEHEGGPKTPSIAPQTLVRTQSEALQVAWIQHESNKTSESILFQISSCLR